VAVAAAILPVLGATGEQAVQVVVRITQRKPLEVEQQMKDLLEVKTHYQQTITLVEQVVEPVQ
jgi:hypothetical protein